LKYLLVITAGLLVLAACDREDAGHAFKHQERPLLASGIDIQYMDLRVRPGDDFFTYVNGKWLEQTRIPRDRSSYGGFNVLAEAAQEDIRAIIEEAASGDFPTGSDQQKVGDLFNSWMDVERRNSLGLLPVEPEFERIDAIRNTSDLARYFADAIRRGLNAPVEIAQFADLKDPGYYGVYALQGGLGLPERAYYLNQDAKSEEIRQKYIEHVAKTLDLAGVGDAALLAGNIMALETRLAAGHMTKENLRHWNRNYHKVAVAELYTVMPGFDWSAYLTALGAEELDALIVVTSDYFRALDGILVDTELDTWKAYLKWSAVNATATRLTADIDAAHFDFYGRVLTGTEAQRALWRRGVNVINRTLGEVVGKVYVDRHFPPEARRRMEALVANLIAAYEVRIRDLDWMSEATRSEALDKLSKFTAKIGYPDQWRDYSSVDIAADDLYGNLERVAIAEHERMLSRIGRTVDRSEWGITPQTVNAYYSPPLNEIVFPAAILRPPFFNLEAEDAVNYGAIGAVIGHEIGHGFDDTGSRFDGDGVLRDWWSERDREEFDRRTARLVEQYDSYRPFDDLAVNGEFTLGENIGDLGGISIGLLAYRLSLAGEESPVIDGFTGVQRVFLGYAQMWRTRYRDEALRLLVATNPHAPAMYRTNGAVRNVPEFYDAFDVVEGDALYLPPAERVSIW
jgi:putative endopeptidase